MVVEDVCLAEDLVGVPRLFFLLELADSRQIVVFFRFIWPKSRKDR